MNEMLVTKFAIEGVGTCTVETPWFEPWGIPWDGDAEIPFSTLVGPDGVGVCSIGPERVGETQAELHATWTAEDVAREMRFRGMNWAERNAAGGFA